MSKKILLFSTFFPPHIGGVEYYSLGLANYLSSNGYEVYVITTTQEPVEIPNFKVLVLDSIGLIGGRFPLVSVTSNNRRIFRLLKDGCFSGAIIQTRFYSLSLLATRFVKKERIPSIVIEHGTGHFTFSNAVINKIGEWYEHLITYFIKKNCHIFYGVSHECCKWLKHFGIEAKGVFYNAIDINEFDNISFSNKSKDGKTSIAFVGRLIPEKGINKLISAFQEIYKDNKNIELLIAGTGEIYDEYKDREVEGISFLGRIAHSRVLELLKKCNIYCFPSDYPEGFPTTILEAAATRTLVITTEAGGAKEFVCDGEYGVLIKENTVPEIARLLQKYVVDVEERERIANNAYNRVMELFTWNTVGKQIMEALNNEGRN